MHEKAHNKWLNKTASVLSGKTAVQMGRDQSANLPRPDLQVMRTRSKTYPKRAPQTAGESGLTYLTLIQLRLPACLPAHCSSVLQLFFEFQLRTSQLNKGFPTNKECLGTSLFDPELIASNFKPYWHHCGHIIVLNIKHHESIIILYFSCKDSAACLIVCLTFSILSDDFCVFHSLWWHLGTHWFYMKYVQLDRRV